MFRKPLPVTGTHKLGGSDAKRLVKDLAKKLRLDADDAETIVGGKKAALELVKSPAPSRVQIYLSDGAPIVIDHSGKGDYELTYFALWRAPGALGEPVVLRHCAVTRFLVRGADLMLPGVGAIPSEPFEVGKRFAVTVPGNPKPLAIGETCVGSADVDARGLAAGQKKGSGKFLRIRSCYRDALWAMAAAHPARPPLLPNEGFLEAGVVGVRGHESHDASLRASLALDEDEEEDEDDERAALDDDDDDDDDASDDEARAETRLNEPVDSNDELNDSEKKETSESMDARIAFAFAYAIKNVVKTASLPTPSTAFWSRVVSPSRAANAPPLDVKRSSHKKMSKLFAELAKKGWLTGKEDKRTKAFVVTSVCRTHAEITGLLSSHENDDDAFETARDADARTKETSHREAERRASMYTGAAFAAFVSEDTRHAPPPLVVEERFRAPNSARSVFAKLAESDSPSYEERFAFSPDQTYTRAEASAVAEAYCELFLEPTPGSDKRQKGGHITLDTTFCDALFKGVLKKGETYPTRVRRADALGSLWLDRFHRVSFLRRGARSATKKGDLPPVRVESERRGGDRKVTRVLGFETYLIDAEELRETLARVLATNCRVEELEATKNRAPGAKAVVAAGNAVEKTSAALLTHYGVPAVHVATKDVFNGKGKNK